VGCFTTANFDESVVAVLKRAVALLLARIDCYSYLPAPMAGMNYAELRITGVFVAADLI
jgi:hypothetical protein